MKILLIAPSSGAWRGLGKKRFFNGKTFRFSMLSLLSVAALTPEGHQLRLIDEQVEDVPWDESFDVVGITVMTATAPRSYELSRRFRERGVPVVLGGFHPTFNADEALQHADVLVMGEMSGSTKLEKDPAAFVRPLLEKYALARKVVAASIARNGIKQPKIAVRLGPTAATLEFQSRYATPIERTTL